MLKSKFFILFACLCCNVIAHANEDMSKTAGYLGTSLGGRLFDNEQFLDNGMFGGIYAGYHLARNVSLETGGRFCWVNLDDDPREDNVNAYDVYVSTLYHFFPDQNFSPFAHLGYSNIKLDTDIIKDCYDNIRYGIGLNYKIKSNINLRSCFSHLVTTSDSYDNYALSFGLNYYFNFEKSKPEKRNPYESLFIEKSENQENDDSAMISNMNQPQPVSLEIPEPVNLEINVDDMDDIDFDGVDDNIDQCLHTPEYVKVNLLGCQILNNTFEHKHYSICSAQSRKNSDKLCHLIPPIYFSTGLVAIDKKELPALNRLILILNQYPDIQVGIWGHTDSEGTVKYNKQLSENRSKSVYNFLTEKGIAANRLKMSGFGYSKPIIPNSSIQNKSKNRRVEFVLLK